MLNQDVLESKLRARKARVAIVGLGYAGLPMAVEFARAGYPCIGFDVDRERVTAVAHGRSPVSNVADAELASLVEVQRLHATIDPSALDAADVAIICVPTPLTSSGGPDLRFVEAAGRTLGEHLHPGMLIVLQSTCGPGTTSQRLVPILEEVSGLRSDHDFFAVFAPERIDPGNTRFNVKNTPKLVGGASPTASHLGCLLYEPCIDEVVPVSSPEIAELAKLVENTFRFVNISFVNEIALLCDRLGVNVWEVIEAANTKPFAFMAHYPGPGVGGHCIPVVPRYLEAAAHQLGLAAALIPAAYRVNDAMPKLVVDKLERALAERLGRTLINANVLLVGMTYKADIADIRESAAVRVFEEAFARGAHVEYHDPLVPSVRIGGEIVHSVTLDSGSLAAADAVILLTPHSSIDYDEIITSARLVLDTHSGLRPREAPNVVNMWVPQATARTPISV